MMRATWLLWAVLAATPAQAMNIDGTPVPDTLTVTGDSQPLVLNGAGVRRKFMIGIYVGALYARALHRTPESVLKEPGTRSMRLHFLREVGADKLADGWKTGFAANVTATELRALDARLASFNGMMTDARKGDVLRLDLMASGQTRVLLNEQLRGTIDGADFQQALLKVWLGEKPADADLKQALLGGGR